MRKLIGAALLAVFILQTLAARVLAAMARPFASRLPAHVRDKCPFLPRSGE